MPSPHKDMDFPAVVNGFTGSTIWHAFYAFPPTSQDFCKKDSTISPNAGCRSSTCLKAENVNFALEVHPTEIAFDIASAQRALEAVKNHPRFGFNYDPSHLGYQGVDYVKFIREFGDRIFHAHMKDVVVGPRRRHGRRVRRPHGFHAMRAATGISARSATATSISRKSSSP